MCYTWSNITVGLNWSEFSYSITWKISLIFLPSWFLIDRYNVRVTNNFFMRRFLKSCFYTQQMFFSVLISTHITLKLNVSFYFSMWKFLSSFNEFSSHYFFRFLRLYSQTSWIGTTAPRRNTRCYIRYWSSVTLLFPECMVKLFSNAYLYLATCWDMF